MKCAKIQAILPSELLMEIQKYIQGEYIYIPSQLDQRKKWGENSGSRSLLQARNENIRNKFESGEKIKDLADEFFLSIDSIKKIVYMKNK